jgi:hypothetical protein
VRSPGSILDGLAAARDEFSPRFSDGDALHSIILTETVGGASLQSTRPIGTQQTLSYATTEHEKAPVDRE